MSGYKKMCYSGILLVIKRNGFLVHATLWRNLPNMPGERSPSQKTANGVIPATQNTQHRWSRRDKSRLVVARDWGWEKWGVMALGAVKMF